jgi:phosphomannomutase
MKNMKDDEIESSFMERGLSFGTGGVRAKMGYGTSVLNMYTYAQLADAFANYLVKKYHSNNFKVVIGHDNRKYSDEFTKKVADVLTSFGISIILFPNNELVPTPLVSFAIRTTKAKAGIVITASHNPKEYNGFKIYDENGCQATEEITHKVSQIVNKPIDILKLNHKPNPSLIAYASKNIYDQYFRSCIGTIINKSIINIKKSLPIVFTGHHGTASKLMPLFLNKYLHFNVLPVKEQCKYDLNFTNSPLPNPEDTNSFDNAIKYAEQIGSEICMGTDPDADRVGVCIKHKGE